MLATQRYQDRHSNASSNQISVSPDENLESLVPRTMVLARKSWGDWTYSSASSGHRLKGGVPPQVPPVLSTMRRTAPPEVRGLQRPTTVSSALRGSRREPCDADLPGGCHSRLPRRLLV